MPIHFTNLTIPFTMGFCMLEIEENMKITISYFWFYSGPINTFKAGLLFSLEPLHKQLVISENMNITIPNFMVFQNKQTSLFALKSYNTTFSSVLYVRNRRKYENHNKIFYGLIGNH